MHQRHFVVYADDDEDDVLLLEDAFLRFGIDLPIKNYKSGTLLLQDIAGIKEQVCLFVIDQNMPGMNGLELISRLKEDPAILEVPIVILSTGLTPMEKQVCADLGINSYKKPLTSDELMMIVVELSKLLSHCMRKDEILANR